MPKFRLDITMTKDICVEADTAEQAIIAAWDMFERYDIDGPLAPDDMDVSARAEMYRDADHVIEDGVIKRRSETTEELNNEKLPGTESHEKPS